jgi:hypothetical protein
MRRWTSAYRFEWTPIITFTTRRLSLLEWVEQNVQPVAFSEGHDHVGIALFNRRIRLKVDRNGLTLEDGLGSDAGVEPLAEAVRGIFEILEPRDTTLASATTAWSGPLQGETYDATRSRFAREKLRLSSASSGLVPIDGSVLMDMSSPDTDCQVEWGIVSNAELVERITRPRVGRLSGERQETSLVGIEAEDLPPVSVFVDTHVHRYAAKSVLTAADGIYEVIKSVDAISKGLAADIHASIATERD